MRVSEKTGNWPFLYISLSLEYLIVNNCVLDYQNRECNLIFVIVKSNMNHTSPKHLLL